MAVNDINKQFVIFGGQLRFGNLDALFAAFLNPNLGNGTQVPAALAEHMHMTAIVVSVQRNRHKDECLYESELSHIQSNRRQRYCFFLYMQENR